jgi:ADP-heptose:LPS heptosyltransferase
MIILNADMHGIGDLCVTSFISEGSKDKEIELIHWATGEKRKVLEILNQKIATSPKDCVTTFNSYYKKELAEAGKRPRVIQRAEFLGIPYPPQRPSYTISEEAKKWANDTHSNSKKLIMIYPQTVWRTREYPAAYWVDLCWILKTMGFEVKVFESFKDERFNSTPQFYWGIGWENQMALMLKAALIIGNDSGPVHVAGVLNRPALALCGPTTSSCFTHIPSVQTISSQCICTGCWFQKPHFRAACDQGCRSLFELKPEIVLEKIIEMVHQ